MRDRGVFNIARALPRMSWSPKNLYNLWLRTQGAKVFDISFKRSNDSLYAQRWRSKAVVRAYHGDYIPEQIFKRWYLPATLPDVRPKRAERGKGDDLGMLEDYARRKKKEKDYEGEVDKKGMAPVGSLMFGEVERRIDVLVFRCCFAHSIYEARRLVIHGDVMLNGKKHLNANTRLAPGDMISVNPKAIRFFQPPGRQRVTDVNDYRKDPKGLTPFYLPKYAAPWLFIPAYIEPNFATCSAIYVRHPTARPGYSEIPTPYDADGDVVRFAWEWYSKIRPRVRTKKQLARMPEDRTFNPEVVDVEAERKKLRRDIARKLVATRGMILN